MEEYRIRVRKSEIMSVLNILLVLCSIVVFLVGAIYHYTEPVIFSLFMIVAAIVFNYYNDSDFIITERGTIIDSKGTFKWEDIELLNIEKRHIVFKIVNEKTMKFAINKNEDKKKISNALKFVNSKIRNSSFEYEIELERKKHREE